MTNFNTILGFLLCLLIGVLSQRVNYVIILVDDLGYNDTNLGKEPFTRSHVNTPNLRQMATEGVLFDQFYTGASVCTPSRGALLTGKFPPKFNFFGLNRVFLSPGQNSGIPDNMTSVASFLKGCDYKTGMTGKWHLGLNQIERSDSHWMPLQKGFDVAELVSPMGNGPSCVAGAVPPCQRGIVNGQVKDFYPFCQSGINDYDCPMRPALPWNCTFGVQIPIGGSAGPDPRRNAGFCSLYRGNNVVQQPWDPANITQRVTDEALKFIDARSTQSGDGKPFFYFFSHFSVHEPYYAGASFFGKSLMGPIGDMVEEVDWSIAQVLNRLRQSDIGPTMVYFLSDNGGFIEKNVHLPNPAWRTSSGPLRGGKGQHYEGGVRTPAIVWGNPQLSTVFPQFQRNLKTHAIGHTIDIFKTIVTQQSDCPAPAQVLDGVDLTPVLIGAQTQSAWQTPNTFLPYFCENIVVAVRWRDPGIPNSIPQRDLKILFALPQWTLPELQACPVPNPYAPSTCSCATLQALSTPASTTNPDQWIKLYDLEDNLNEDPSKNLLLNPNPQIVNYYLQKLQTVVQPYLNQLRASFDSNPLSPNGIYDVRVSTPAKGPAFLVPCPGDPVTCTINSEPGATQVTVGSSPNPSYFGQAVTFQATVSPVGSSSPITSGTVFFRNNNPTFRVALGPQLSLGPTGVFLKTDKLPVNAYTVITAEYEGQSPTYLAATSGEYIQKVLPAQTSIELSLSPSSPLVGEHVIITAKLTITQGAGKLDGDLDFQVIVGSDETAAALPLQTVAVDGAGSYHVSHTFQELGNYVIVADYKPNSTNFQGIRQTTTVLVKGAPVKMKITSTPCTSVIVGQPIVFSIALTSGYGVPSGKITFQPDGTEAVLNGKGETTATITILDQIGQISVTIQYSGDAKHVGATEVKKFEVKRASTTITLSRNPNTNKVQVGETVTLTALVKVNSPSTLTAITGSVEFNPGNIIVPLDKNIAETTISALHIKSGSLFANYIPNSNLFSPSTSNTLLQIVVAATTTLTLTSEVNGNQRKFIATVKANDPSTAIPIGIVIWTIPKEYSSGKDKEKTPLVDGIASLTLNDVQFHQITATFEGDHDFITSSAKLDF